MDVEITKPGRDWNESVASIVATAKFFLRMRENFDRASLVKMAKIDYNIDESTIDKIVKISNHPILSDPKYFDKLPPQWGTLYEMKFLPDELLRQKIEAGDAQYATKYKIWEWRGVKTRDRAGMSGAKVKLTDNNQSLIQYIKEGMTKEKDFQTDDMTAEVAALAKSLKVGVDTYRKVRSMILLSERPELTEHDRNFVADMLQKVDKTRNVRTYFHKLKPLMEKIWGTSRNKSYSDKSSQQRVDKFRNAIVILSDTCERVLEMEQPYMPAEDIDKSIGELTEASKTIRRIAENLRRAKDV